MVLKCHERGTTWDTGIGEVASIKPPWRNLKKWGQLQHAELMCEPSGVTSRWAFQAEVEAGAEPWTWESRKLLVVQAVTKFKFYAYGRREADKTGKKTTEILRGFKCQVEAFAVNTVPLWRKCSAQSLACPERAFGKVILTVGWRANHRRKSWPPGDLLKAYYWGQWILERGNGIPGNSRKMCFAIKKEKEHLGK